MTPKTAFVFDFDGTLVDTAVDLAATTNRLLVAHGRPPRPYEFLRKDAGRGSEILIPSAFEIERGCDFYHELRSAFFEDYAAHCADDPQLFPGIEEALLTLNRKEIPWGIVTNKPARFVEAIAKARPVLQTAIAVFTPENLQNTKPHPEGILRVLEVARVKPELAYYFGDDERDAVAARAAGVTFVACAYGYLGKNPDVDSWRPDIIYRDSRSVLELAASI